MSLRIRRGPEADRMSVTYELGEFVYITDSGILYIGDGSTVGGNPIGGPGILDAATLNGQPGTYYLDRTNHTGTQLAATISDFNSAVDSEGDTRYVQLSGSYADPSWITSLDYAKLTGVPPGTGEANTASSLGGGLSIYATKVGVDLQFNSFKANDFDLSSNLISIDYTNGQEADTSTKGFLTSTDWNTFNSKLSSYTETDPTFSSWLSGPPNVSEFTNDVGYITSISGAVTSVSGTANRITSTGGATPVIDIDSAYDALWQPVDATLTALAGLTITANSLVYGTGTDAFSILAQNTTGTRKFLREVSSTAPTWDTLASGDIPDLSATYLTVAAASAGYQPLDGDLTAIAALTTDSFGRDLLTKTSAANVRTYIGAGTSSFSGAFSALSGIPTTLSGYGITDAQPLDSDLTTLAGLTATTDNFIVSVSSAWASRTPAQVKTTLSLNNVENTALSTWAGSANITTLGTIATGIWNGTPIVDSYISSAATWNAKQNAITTGTTSQYFRGDLSLATFPTNVSTFTNDAGYWHIAATAIKTANYTASANEFVPFDTTSGSLVLTLPTAPTDKTLVAVKMITQGGTNTVTVNSGGTDVINKAGNTTAVLNYLNQSNLYQYEASSGIWYNFAGTITAGQIFLAMSGDVTANSSGVTTIGASKVTNSMLAGSIAYSKLSLTGAILNADLAGSIDAAKINTGVVSNTEFNYLDGVTSAIQTQIDGKVPTTRTVAGFALSGDVTLAALTATDATLTFSGSYNGSTARTVGINLTTANTWTGVITDTAAAPQIILGVNTTTLGAIKMFGNTSGDATIQPAAIAGTATVVTLPNASSTLPIFGQQITFTGPTAARSIALPDAAFTVARSDAAQTFTGVQTFSSAPVIGSITNTGTLTLPTVTGTAVQYIENTITSNATWSPTGDARVNWYQITAQAGAATTISNPSGTPSNHNELYIRVKDDGTSRALTWSGSQWRASSDLPLPTGTTLGKTMYMKFIFNGADTKWDLVSMLDNF